MKKVAYTVMTISAVALAIGYTDARIADILLIASFFLTLVAGVCLQIESERRKK